LSELAQRFAVHAHLSVQRLGHLALNAPLSAPVSIPSQSRLAFNRSWAKSGAPAPASEPCGHQERREQQGDDLHAADHSIRLYFLSSS
jgi:hypothetical protein